MMTGFNVVFILYVVFLVAVGIVAIILALLLCRLVIAARENQLVTARLRELQIERMLLDDDSEPGPGTVTGAGAG